MGLETTGGVRPGGEVPLAPRKVGPPPAPSMVAESLGHAFLCGLPWSPAYHTAWLARTPDGRLPTKFEPIPRARTLTVDAEQTPSADERPGETLEIKAKDLFGKLVAFRAMLEKSDFGSLEERANGIEMGLRGISATGLNVTEGPLDLRALVLPAPIAFQDCRFDAGIVLDNARLGDTSFHRSEFSFLHADALRVDGDLLLAGITKTDRINLRGAQIAGALFLHASTLNPENKNVGGTVLNCNGATVGGSVLLNKGSANGEVNFQRATIGGQLNCMGGHFTNHKSRALNCDAATIGASVFLTDGFVAEGEVNFVRANIHGNLDCSGAQFTNHEDPALVCASATIGTSVFLCEGFASHGEVNFVGTAVGGQIDCSGGQFTNDKGPALICDAASVGADVFLRDGFVAKGEVNFVRASIHGNFDCGGGQFTNTKGLALICDSATIGANGFLNRGFTAQGEVNFVRCSIVGNLRCNGGSFAAPSGTIPFAALDLRDTKIGSGLYLHKTKQMAGQLDLRNATVDYFVDDNSAWPKGGKLDLDGFQYNRFADAWETGGWEDFAKSSVEQQPRTAWWNRGWLKNIADGLRIIFGPGAAKREGATPVDFASRDRWLMLQPKADLNHALKPQPWTQCANVLRAMGHSHDARLLLHKRDELWLRSGQPDRLTRLFYVAILGPLAGYGYKTERALYAMIALILSGWIVFTAADAKGLVWRAPGESASVQAEEFHALAYTIDVFLPAVDLGEQKLWLPRGRAEAVSEKSNAPRVVRSLAVSICPSGEDLSSVLGTRRVQLADACSAYIQPVLTLLLKPLDWALDAGLARLWMWVEILMGWMLLGIITAGLAGVLQRKTE